MVASYLLFASVAAAAAVQPGALAAREPQLGNGLGGFNFGSAPGDFLNQLNSLFVQYSFTLPLPVPSSTAVVTSGKATASVGRATSAPTGTGLVKPASSSASRSIASMSGVSTGIKTATSTGASTGIKTGASTGALTGASTGSGSVSASRSRARSSASSTATGTSSSTLSGPTVQISSGTVVGSTTNGIDEFLAIPYAQPPVGALRFKPPIPLNSSFGILNATLPANACPQFAVKLTGSYDAGGIQTYIDKYTFAPTNQSEDCLTMSVWRPSNVTADSKLPVLFWIYGGAFEFGATSMYSGKYMVQRSIDLGAPVIFVAVNYRVGGFGFMAGADLAAEQSTNLGLRDQRLGLMWNSDNVAAFGGDPDKVTIWGESAGSISTCYQTVINHGNNTYNGRKLFRAQIGDSGCLAPANNASAPQAQAIYDHVVDKTGCSAATASGRLTCLRSVDYNILVNATNSVPNYGGYRSCDLSYLPRVDTGDDFYSFDTEFAIAAGQWTKTPFILGDQEDEGTISAINQNNITTNDELVEYLATWFPQNPTALSDVRGLAALYPDNATAGQPDGSPFDTGSENNIYPQYKRLAAIIGDIVFTISRRAALNFGSAQGVNTWSYLSTYLHGLPTFGTLHGSDLVYLFEDPFQGLKPTMAIQTYYISFVNYLDPNQINNTATSFHWPTYSQAAPVLAEFSSGDVGSLNDTFRAPVYDYLVKNVFGFQI